MARSARPDRGTRASLGRAIATSLADRLRTPLPSRVNHVALGTFCHIASALRDTGLRRWTGPFDWIFSTPAMVAECLETGFAAFLDPAHLVSVPPAELANGASKQARHLHFEARYELPAVFNHHDPAKIASDLSALQRAVTRLKTALATPLDNVLYMISQDGFPEHEMVRIRRALGEGPARNVLVAVDIRPGATPGCLGTPLGSPETREHGGAGCRRIDLVVPTETRSTGIRFAVADDDPRLNGALEALGRDLEAEIARDRPGRPGV